MRNIIMQQNTINRLMQNDYLHSNTDNFVESAKDLIMYKKNEEINNFNDVLKELQSAIESFINKINDMYLDLGIKSKDSWSKEGGYVASGAAEFKRKFLIDEFLKDKSDLKGKTITQKILTVMNSQQSLNELTRIGNEVMSNKLTKIKYDEEEKELLDIIQKITGKWMKDVENLSANTVNNFVDRLFTNSSRIRLVTKSSIKQEDLNKLLEKLKLYNLNLSHKDDVLKLQSAIKTQLSTKFFYREIANKYYDFLAQYFKSHKEDGITFINQIDRNFFIEEFVKTLNDYSSIDFKKAEKDSGILNNLKGFLLEFGFYTSLSMGKFNASVKILGQQLEKRIYTNIQKDIKNKNISNKEKSEKVFTSQSASDIVFQTNGKEYRLQLKNNLLDKDILSFRAQPEIKISTFLPTAIENESMRNTLSYFLINFGFLKKFGLDKEGNENRLSEKDVPEIKDFIILLLETGYKFILGTEYLTEVQKTRAIEQGNIAYVFQGKFLIPIAMYFASAFELLYKLQNNSNSFRESSIGGLSLPTYTNVKNEIFSNTSTPINAVEFQRQKHSLIKKMKNIDAVYGEYRYPEMLLEYGSLAGHQMYNNMSFKLRITLVLNNLKNLLTK